MSGLRKVDPIPQVVVKHLELGDHRDKEVRKALRVIMASGDWDLVAAGLSTAAVLTCFNQ
jgi:hypothetical protein